MSPLMIYIVSKALHKTAMVQGDKILDMMMPVLKLMTDDSMYKALQKSFIKIKSTPLPEYKDLPPKVRTFYRDQAINLIKTLESKGYVIKRQ
jgi:hypothetical protein